MKCCNYNKFVNKLTFFYTFNILFLAVLEDNCACGGRFTDYAKLDDTLCEDGIIPLSNEIAYRPVYQAWSEFFS